MLNTESNHAEHNLYSFVLKTWEPKHAKVRKPAYEKHDVYSLFYPTLRLVQPVRLVQALPHLVTSMPKYHMMISVSIFWYYHDISKYQGPPHLITSMPKYHMMISVSIFWYYHDILILSWYIKISSPSTLSHIHAKISYDDIGIDILILSWYSDIIMIYQNIKPLHT